jgi:wyosine [tRNA(Phe)-imidazoG37] synthetase (radical SAM superfamily)
MQSPLESTAMAAQIQPDVDPRMESASLSAAAPLRARSEPLMRQPRPLLVSITPVGGRVCSFDCVFCSHRCDQRPRGASWPKPGNVGSAVGSALSRLNTFDSVTITGLGEPTLHPRFPDVVAEIIAQVRRAKVRLPVGLLTNGTQTPNEVVSRTLEQLDEIVVKFDAASRRVNRPSSWVSDRERVVAIGALNEPIVQACFVEGMASNCDPQSITEWIGSVADIRPSAVRICTLRQHSATPNLQPASWVKLREIAELVWDTTAVNTEIHEWIPRSTPEGLA